VTTAATAKRGILALGIGLLALLAMGGVAVVLLLRPSANPARLTSFDARDAVVYFDPLAVTNWLRAGGYLVSFDTLGDHSRFQTAGMAASSVSWTHHGLFFADRDNDYLVTDGIVQVIPSPKASNQDGLVVLENGDWVGVYNAGADTEVVITNTETADKSLVNIAVALVVAACGNDVFAVYPDLDSPILLPGSDSNTLNLGLTRIVHNGNHDETLIAYQPPIFAETDFINGTAPCVNNEVVYLSTALLAYGSSRDDYGGDVNHQAVVDSCLIQQNTTGLSGCATIERWNVVTGQRSVIALKDDTGLAVDLTSFSGPNNYSADSLRGDELYWWHPDGLLLATNIYSGSTRLISEHEHLASERYQYLFDVVANSAFVLMMPMDATGTGITGLVKQISLPTGELLAEYDYTNVDIGIGNNQIPWSFAVNPDFN